MSSGSLSISPALAHAYWNAALHSTPPNLPTTFGNFTCVNSIARFTHMTQASQSMQMQFIWSPSALRTTSFTTTFSAGSRFSAWQQSQLNATNTVPLDIRPLRMSVRIKNTTQNLNIASNIVAVLVPQSLSLTYGTAGTLGSMPFTDQATTISLWSFAANNPKAVSYSGKELAKGMEFVLPPSSFLAYNQYSDWVPLTNFAQGSTLPEDDWEALNGITTTPLSFPFTYANSWWGNVPPVYNLLINFEPNALVQSFEIEVFCQDACRFPANSLVAGMATNPAASSLDLGSLSRLASAGADAFHQPSGSRRGGRDWVDRG
jgi:hypothetical protein